MHHEILGEHFQWLKIEMQLESIRGDYAKLLFKSEAIKIKDENIFFGAGMLVFSGGGKIKEFYLTDTEAVIFSKENILAAYTTTEQESLSSNYLSLVKVSGPGTVFVWGTDFAEFYLEEEETAEVRTSCIAALDSTIIFQLGSRFSVLSGPGAAILRSTIPEEKEEPREFFLDQL